MKNPDILRSSIQFSTLSTIYCVVERKGKSSCNCRCNPFGTREFVASFFAGNRLARMDSVDRIVGMQRKRLKRANAFASKSFKYFAVFKSGTKFIEKIIVLFSISKWKPLIGFCIHLFHRCQRRNRLRHYSPWNLFDEKIN